MNFDPDFTIEALYFYDGMLKKKMRSVNDDV